jgi:predicted Rossmann fold flavoprotein
MVDVIVIGAGAAGLLAATRAAQVGAKVLLLEKNTKAGVKILMSGGTRCNLTHDCDARGIIEGFGKNGPFLHNALGVLGPRDVVEMFERRGVATKIESTGKVFPASDRALDVRDALVAQAQEAGVRIQLATSVLGLRPTTDDGFEVTTSSETLHARRLIVTTGGQSYPGCGTTGDGYGWLQALGHTIVSTHPALVPLTGGTSQSQSLSGLTLPDVQVAIEVKGGNAKRPAAQRRSSLLLTHFGFSGPAAMDVSRAVTALGAPHDATLVVDLLPDRKESSIDPWWEEMRRSSGGKLVSTALAQWVPQRLADSLLSSAGLMATTRISELPNAGRRAIGQQLKRWTLPLTGSRGYAKAEVTAGGVSLSEVDPRTMASRIVPGLYIAGEVLDLDGWIGGYNFQSAFSTGHVAGLSAAHSLALQ